MKLKNFAVILAVPMLVAACGGDSKKDATVATCVKLAKSMPSSARKWADSDSEKVCGCMYDKLTSAEGLDDKQKASLLALITTKPGSDAQKPAFEIMKKMKPEDGKKLGTAIRSCVPTKS